MFAAAVWQIFGKFDIENEVAPMLMLHFYVSERMCVNAYVAVCVCESEEVCF